jgi:xylose isomerase
VQAALAGARLPELARPTLGEGEDWKQLLDWELPDPDPLGAIGAATEHLDQLALEHLYGVR